LGGPVNLTKPELLKTNYPDFPWEFEPQIKIVKTLPKKINEKKKKIAEK
jgi:hypothetical protein